MPLFKRPDGELITNESPVRRMLPYLMRGRNESVVYHEQVMDLTLAKPWLKTYNQHHKQAATLFHLMLYAFGRGMHERPGLNRFVSGARLYQRRGVQLSFAAKESFHDTSPLKTVKMSVPEVDPFTPLVERVVRSIKEARGDSISMVDKELGLALALPGWLLTTVMWLLRFLDHINLLPGFYIESDPMYASMFVANLGSLGLDRSVHHLYEYGTISLFATLGTPKKTLVVGPNDQPVVRETIEVRWAFDERVNDGFYAARAMRVAQRIIEDPLRYMGEPTANADKPPVAALAAAAGSTEAQAG